MSPSFRGTQFVRPSVSPMSSEQRPQSSCCLLGLSAKLCKRPAGFVFVPGEKGGLHPGELGDGRVCDLTCSQLIAMHGNSSSAPKGQVCGDTGHSVRIRSWQNLLSPVSAVEMLFLVGFRVRHSGLGVGCSANHRKFAQRKFTISPARAGVG